MIRAARSEESDVLTALTLRSKAHWGYDDEFMRTHRRHLSVTPEYIARNPTFVMELDGALVGFYAIEPLDGDQVELGFLFVEPALIGRGLGQQLLAHAVATARELGRTRMRIVSDPHAVDFYRRMGARDWGAWLSPVVPGRLLPVLELDCR